MKVYGQLVYAQLEQLASNPTGGGALEGRIYGHTSSHIPFYHDGTAFRGMLLAGTGQIVNADVNASAAIAGTKLVAAASGVAGAVSTALQVFSGLKKFSGGLVDCADELSGDTNYTMDDTYRRHVYLTGLAAARTINLPTTSVLAGEVFVIENRTAQELTVKSSDGVATIDIINTGYIVLRAKQATPTAAAHWTVVDVSEIVTDAAQTVNHVAATGYAVTLTFLRENRRVTISMAESPNDASKTNTTVPVTSGTMLTRFRPATAKFIPAVYRNSGGGVDAVGYWQVNTSGTIQFQNATGAAWTASVSTFLYSTSVTYFV